MTTLELYSVYERALIMLTRDLHKYLRARGYFISVNESKSSGLEDCHIMLKSIFSHQYSNEPFVSQEMPEESDAFNYWFPTQYDTGFPILYFRFEINGNHNKPKEQKATIFSLAYLDEGNSKICLETTICQIDEEKTTHWRLNDWKKQLCFLSKSIKDTFNK